MINCRWGRHKRRRWMMAIKVWAVTSVVKLILWSWRQKRWWWKMVLDLSFEKHCKVPTFIFPLAKICTKSLKSSAGQSLSSGQSSANLKMVGNLQQRKWANPIRKCSALRMSRWSICVQCTRSNAVYCAVQVQCSALKSFKMSQIYLCKNENNVKMLQIYLGVFWCFLTVMCNFNLQCSTREGTVQVLCCIVVQQCTEVKWSAL